VTNAPASALANNTVTERTEAGEQLLAPFVRPVSVRQRLDHLTAQPLTHANPKASRQSGSSTRPLATS
jgi:hypothetical protein